MPSAQDRCPFCRIADGVAHARFVAGAPGWVAFFPERPATLGHTLIVPRLHTHDFWALAPDVARALAEAAWQLGPVVADAVSAAGMNLITSAGPAAEQTVEHVHLHLLPRHDGDTVTIWPEASPAWQAAELDECAARIRRAALLNVGADARTPRELGRGPFGR